MSDAPRDANQVTARMGSFNGVPVPIKVEHATGFLKLSASLASFSAPVVSTNLAKHDDNCVPSETGYTGSAVKPILVQHSSGRLRVVGV